MAGEGWSLLYRVIRDQERLIAFLATDLTADIDTSDAEGGLASRTGHHDPFLRRGCLDRMCGGLARPRCARNLRVFGHERLLAVLALHLLADEHAADPQGRRAVGAYGDEVRLRIVHGKRSRASRSIDIRKRDYATGPREELPRHSIFPGPWAVFKRRDPDLGQDQARGLGRTTVLIPRGNQSHHVLSVLGARRIGVRPVQVD